MSDTRLDPRSRPSDLGPQILRILPQILSSRPSAPEIQPLDPKILTRFRPLFVGLALLGPNHLIRINPTTPCVVIKGPQAHNQSLVTLRVIGTQYLTWPRSDLNPDLQNDPKIDPKWVKIGSWS